MAQIKNTSSGDEEACMLAMQLATASILPMVLRAAIELDLLEIIATAGPGTYVTPNEIASMLPTSSQYAPVMLDRILRVLASYSVLKCKLNELANGQVERAYGLTKVAKFLTENADGVSMAPLALLNTDKIMMESWYYLKDAVLDDGGLPFSKAFGMNVYEYCGTDLRLNKIFNRAMKDHSAIVVKKILEKYNGFEGLGSLVDVGGGTGATINTIVSKYPTIKGINFDLPHVVEDAPSYTGVEHVRGDMFASVPKGDAIFLKWICHNWSDERCLKLLRNCHQAVAENGKIVIADSILPEYPENATKTAIHFDAIMLAYIPGGRERTEKEFEALAKSAGFKRFNKVCSALDIWIMELCKY
ncbi:hypothetical protein DCAR_0310175 [Daucus carota subsp. sativus]|uniref:Caffeic acid O-methyltransferase n=2 Tax=Daucus carota subsp. sativus TaxID=79200 RepID=A0AAF1AQ07_DAUCS|nr:hypothetical protein DCAR_0310175 [Daucus carota subsp. sativus]